MYMNLYPSLDRLVHSKMGQCRHGATDAVQASTARAKACQRSTHGRDGLHNQRVYGLQRVGEAPERMGRGVLLRALEGLDRDLLGGVLRGVGHLFGDGAVEGVLDDGRDEEMSS